MATLTSIINNIIQKVNNLTSNKVNKVTSTDNAVVRFNGTAGEVQNSSVIIDDSGNVGVGLNNPHAKLGVAHNDTVNTGANNNTVGSSIGIDSPGAPQPILGMRWSALRAGIGGHNYSSQIVADSANNLALEMYTTGATPLIFGTNSTERMRIDDSGIVGFKGGNGASPNISAGLGISAVNGGNNIIYSWLDTSSIDLWAGISQKTGIHINGQTASGGSYVNINTGGAERMRIDSAGNVGVGVNPSAWYSGVKAIELGSYSAISQGQGGELNLESNCYKSAANIWTYKGSGVGASRYVNNFGQHVWYTAPSGTAGNPITWTNAMTLAANGNLLVGTTTDNGIDKLQVAGSISSGTIQVIYNGNLNDYKTRTQVLGTYPSSYVSNIPINDHGYLEVIVYSANNYVMQRFTTLGVLQLSPGRIFVRCLVGGTWSAWVEK